MTGGGFVERTGGVHGRGLRLAVVASRFNQAVTQRLLDGAMESLAEHGVETATVTVAWVPGAFELPLAALRLASDSELDAVVCLGAVIRGETDHYEHVATQCAAGLQRVQLDTGVPVIFGVLTTETVAEAEARAGGEQGNKGAEAATTAIEMANLLGQLSKEGID